MEKKEQIELVRKYIISRAEKCKSRYPKKHRDAINLGGGYVPVDNVTSMLTLLIEDDGDKCFNKLIECGVFDN